MIHWLETCTIKRQVWTATTLTSESTIATGVNCIFSPASSQPVSTPFGMFPQQSDLIFLPAGTDIKMGDIIINDAIPTELWIASNDPKDFKNPITNVADHIEVDIVRKMDAIV